MIWIYVHLCGIVLVTAIEYQLSCPDKLQRHLRGQNCTARGTHYLCLFNILDNINMENCASEDFKAQPGFRKIRKPGITNGNCTVDRYQPIIFSTYKFNDCMYTKSSCEEKGQVVVSDRKGNQDRTCRCDYRTGYSYIIQPRNLCACVPSEEDCSCMRKYCGHNETLSADYKCVPVNKLTLTACSKISTPLIPGIISPPPGNTSLQQELFTTFIESSSGNASAVILSILLFWIGVMILLKLRVSPELISYKIEFDKQSHVINTDVKTETYTVIEGCKVKVVFIYKSLLPCEPIIKKVSTRMLKGEKEAEKGVKSDEKPKDIQTEVHVPTGRVLNGEKEAEKRIKSDEKPKDIPTEVHVPTGGVLNGEKGAEKRIKSDKKPMCILTALKRESSFVSTNLTEDNTGTFELVLKNKIGLPSTLMEKWKRFHARLVNFLYNVDDDKNSPGFELMISKLPESFEKVDVFFGKKIEFQVRQSTANESKLNAGDKPQLNKDDVKKVVWFRVYKEDQFTVIQTDKSEHQKEHKYFIDERHNPSLTINQTCMSDAGSYVCFELDGGVISNYGWELRVIPQESGYKEMQVHKIDKDHVSLPFVSDAKQCLEKNSIVVLKGREGTGKTKMALDLALLLEEKGYLPIIVESEEDIKEEFDDSYVLYIFDISNASQVLWKKELKWFMSNNQSRFFAKAIFTCRWLDLCEFKDFKDLTMDINYGLPEDVKMNIFRKYLVRNNVDVVPSAYCNFNSKAILNDSNLQVKLDADSVRKIVKEEPLKGFPLMARLFCSDRHNLHIGEKYFTNPPKDIIESIVHMRTKASASGASQLEVLRYVILVYITLSEENQLDINKVDYRKFTQTKATINKDFQPWPLEVKDILQDVEDAAYSLVGDYLSCSNNVYELIHQDLLKAVMFSYDDITDYIVNNCSLKLILRVIRGQQYKNCEGEAILKLRDDKESMLPLIKILLTKLTQRAEIDTSKPDEITLKGSETSGGHTSTVVPNLESSFPDAATTTDIGNYIYEYWIKEKELFFCMGLFGFLTDSINRKSSEDNSDSSKRKNSEDNKVNILPWQMLTLMRHMTRDGNDPWVFSIKDIPDEIVMFGLLSAGQSTTRTDTLDKMLDILKCRISTEGICDKKNTFQSKLVLPLDRHKNSFFHYLVLYRDTEGSLILRCCFKVAKGKNDIGTANDLDFHPIDIAVALGKKNIFKMFWGEVKGRTSKEKLKKIFMVARKSSHRQENSATKYRFDVNLSFDPEVSRSVHTGSEEDYEAIEEILWK